MSELLDKFRGVDDPCIIERVLVAAYGETLRTNDKKGLAKPAASVDAAVFLHADSVPAHIKVREYACGVMKAAAYRRVKVPRGERNFLSGVA